MNYREYISDYLSRHPDIHPVPVDISAIYKNQIKDKWKGYGNEEFRRNANLLPSTLSREDVFCCFQESKYKGFVAAMLWGGMSPNHIKNAMSYPQNKVTTILEKISEVLNTEHDIRKSYSAFSGRIKINRTNCHIPGVGESYFTKLLFFLNCHDNIYVPLIYDNQLKRVHAALMKDDGMVDEYFTIRYGTTKNGGKFVVPQKLGRNNPSGWQNVDFYMDYLNRMKSLADSYNMTPGELEGVLFGSKIRSRSFAEREREMMENPRAFVRNYLEPRDISVFGSRVDIQDQNTNIDRSPKLKKRISNSNSQATSPSKISTGDWFDVETRYANKSNGHELVFLNRKFKNAITEHYNAGDALEIQLGNQFVKIKADNPYKYPCFRQREITNWAKQKENEGSIQNGQAFTIRARFICN